jgi:hypothetical protein
MRNLPALANNTLELLRITNEHTANEAQEAVAHALGNVASKQYMREGDICPGARAMIRMCERPDIIPTETKLLAAGSDKAAPSLGGDALGRPAQTELPSEESMKAAVGFLFQSGILDQIMERLDEDPRFGGANIIIDRPIILPFSGSSPFLDRERLQNIESSSADMRVDHSPADLSVLPEQLPTADELPYTAQLEPVKEQGLWHKLMQRVCPPPGRPFE